MAEIVVGRAMSRWDRTSQSNEAVILRKIFHTYGTTTKRFIEFGCGKGDENNTIALLNMGWSGIWYDSRFKSAYHAANKFRHYPVVVKLREVTPENVNQLVAEPLDLLSIDIDGNDYAVWEALQARPRVVCIEYCTINGTSLEGMKQLAARKGYEFFRTSASGVNAFFLSL